jgi:cobalt-zinc-cadmium efflux system membrane fusion protein
MKTMKQIITLLFTMAFLAACSKQSESPPKKETASQPVTEAKPDPKRLYCKEHQCYEDVCIFCHEELREKGRLWCKEHNRYEDRCWICHPDQQDKKRAYCEKHFLYADECFLCNPGLKDKPRPTAQATPGKRLLCKEHGVPEDECGICHPDLVGKIDPGQGLKVRFASRQSAAKGGVETAKAQFVSIADSVECYAEVVFDQNRLAQIASPVGGIVQSVEVDLGSRVEEGAVLGRITSAAIGEAVSKSILTRQTLDRERKLRADRVSSEKDLQEAEAAYKAGYQQLKTLGFNDAQIDALAQNPKEAAVLQLRAPFTGEIVERNAVRGSLVEMGKPLFTLADRSTMWAMLNIPEKNLAHVHVGQQVEFNLEALSGKTFTGKLTWIAAQVDERTRMAKARAEIANADGALKAQMFAQARILTHESDKAVVVPQSAIQSLDGKPFVFVKIEADLYEARPVRIGAKHNGDLEILAGVRAEDSVVVARSFIVKSELLKSRLGAGCVD